MNNTRRINSKRIHLRIGWFTIACSYNRELKQIIFWIGRREFPPLKNRYIDIEIGRFRYPKT